MQTRMIRSMIK